MHTETHARVVFVDTENVPLTDERIIAAAHVPHMTDIVELYEEDGQTRRAFKILRRIRSVSGRDVCLVCEEMTEYHTFRTPCI